MDGDTRKERIRGRSFFLVLKDVYEFTCMHLRCFCMMETGDWSLGGGHVLKRSSIYAELLGGWFYTL